MDGRSGSCVQRLSQPQGCKLCMWSVGVGLLPQVRNQLPCRDQLRAQRINSIDMLHVIRALYFAALTTFFVMAYMTLFHYFGKQRYDSLINLLSTTNLTQGWFRFEMTYWGYTFPLATLAVVTIQYYRMVQDGLVKVCKAISTSN